MDDFLKVVFISKGPIIKRQWNCNTIGFWTKRSIQDNFLLIMHENLYVFSEPLDKEKKKEYEDYILRE